MVDCEEFANSRNAFAKSICFLDVVDSKTADKNGTLKKIVIRRNNR